MKLENAVAKADTDQVKICLNMVYDYVIEKIGGVLNYEEKIELDIEEISNYMLASDYGKAITSINTHSGKSNAKMQLRWLAEKGFGIYNKDSGKFILNESL